MEFTGVKVDRDILRAISEELAVGLAIDEKNIYELAGAKFNINSPKQLGKVLFEDLGLRIIKKPKAVMPLEPKSWNNYTVNMR
jgi:DNA polymerase-1